MSNAERPIRNRGLVASIAALGIACVVFSGAAMGQRDPALSGQQWAREWVDRAHQGCLAEERERAEALTRVRGRYRDSALSLEQVQFADREAAGYARRTKRDRTLVLRRLNYAIFRQKRRSLGDRVTDAWARAQGAVGIPKQSFEKVIEKLFSQAAPCELELLEYTLIHAIYGVPLEVDANATYTNEIAERQLRQSYASMFDNDLSIEDAIRNLRVSPENEGWHATDHLLDLLTARSSNRPDALSEEERNAFLTTFERYLRVGAEGVRVRFVVSVWIAEWESLVGEAIPDRLVEQIQNDVQDRFARDLKQMEVLGRMPPSELAHQLSHQLQAWTRAIGPRIERSIYEDPFSAFWLYVQTGLVVRKPMPYQGAVLHVGAETPLLGAYWALSPRQAAERAGREQTPDHFIQQYLEMEAQLGTVELAPTELLRRCQQAGCASKTQAELRDFTEARASHRPISLIDIYGQTIRGATRRGAKLSKNAIRSAADAFGHAKRERLEEIVASLPENPERERLAAYLRTAGEWMVELETRQTYDSNLQELLGGGPIGWTMRRLGYLGGLPKEMFVPEGVTSPAFVRLVDDLVATNSETGADYRGKETGDIQFIIAGPEYKRSIVHVIDTAETFLNIQQFDWKYDMGGREIAYRLMAKKLGYGNGRYLDFERTFAEGIPLRQDREPPTYLYDVPAKAVKALLGYHFFQTTDHDEISSVRLTLERQLGGTLVCTNVMQCGDLAMLFEKAGGRYNTQRENEPGYGEIWRTFQDLESIFAEHAPQMSDVRPRRSLSEYFRDRGRMQRFVSRFGLRRADRPDEEFPINIVVDGKQRLPNTKWLRFSPDFPYIGRGPSREIYNRLSEFNIRVLMWRGLLQFPWHIGRVPIPGAMWGGKVPVPWVPVPLLHLAPGLGWLGSTMSVAIQHGAATDPRNWWAMAAHGKSISSEIMALESGMGFGSKYFNPYGEFKHWHDAGVIVQGPVVADINDQFVRSFNDARVNNKGLAESVGVKIPQLVYQDYAYKGVPAGSQWKTWMLTTDNVQGNFNYIGIMMAALASAQKNIYIEQGFFSDPLIPRMLRRKAREFRSRVICADLSESACEKKRADAVQIHLILPEGTDKPAVDLSFMAEFYEMIHEGVKVYRWNPRVGWADTDRMVHTKAWMVDYEPGKPAFAYAGSHNANQRAHLTDYEIGIASNSPEFAEQLYENLFEPDIKRNARLTLRTTFYLERVRSPAVVAARHTRNFLAWLLWFY